MEKRLITKEAVKQVIKDYWAQMTKYPWQTTIAVLAPAIGNICIFYIPTLLVAKIVNLFIEKQQISLSFTWHYIVAFGAIWLAGEALWRLGIFFLTRVEAKGINTLMQKSLTSLLDKDYGFFADNFVGTLTKKASAYARNYENIVDTISFNISSQIIPMIFAFYILWGYSPWIPAVLFFCVVLIVVIAIPIIKKRAKIVAERHDANSKLAGRLSDTVTNILTIKSFAKEKQELKIFTKYSNLYAQKFKEAVDFQNLRYDTIISPIYVITNTLGLVMAIYFSLKLNMAYGTILVVYSYFAQVTRVFWSINSIYRTIESSFSEAAEFTQLFINPAAIQDMPKAKSLIAKEGRISFNNVCFNYDEAKDDESCFLSCFNLEIEPKQKIGLVGPSGGGKTTITKLLLRFVDPKSGEILIDGQNIGAATQSSLRNAISYVPQEPLLFHRTLMENIAYDRPNCDKEDIYVVAKLAHADEFIEKLPEKYETLVGERGIKLSGGQRQRVAIARAMLKKAPILVLDEATSALDSESEKYIQEGLWELMKDKTAIVIAHRLSTIKHLDRILVLDDGKIVQDGTHEELIEQKGIYAKLWQHQAGSEKERTKKLSETV